MTCFKNLIPSTLLAAALLGAPLAMAETPANAPTSPPHHMQGEKMDPEQMMERHITKLHDVLKVTDSQEEQWKMVAQTMRDNQKTLRDLAKEKRAKAESQTAAEDLVAYSEIAQVHATAIKKLSDVFGVFYAGLSDDQKKAADAYFRDHKRHHEMNPERKHPQSRKE
jgi:Spy/CpxP family protein refolding chaperone